MKKVSFTFDGREASLEQPFIYDVAEVEAKSTQVFDALIKIPPDVGFLLKAKFYISIMLMDPRNTDVEPNPCIHSFPYEIRTGFHYVPVPD
jgi:hypothetical protein